MDWTISIFRITIQPDINKTLRQRGVKVTNIPLDEQQTCGVMLMIHNIFGDNYRDHILVELVTGKEPRTYVLDFEPIINVPALIPYSPQDYIMYVITSTNIILPYIRDTDKNTIETWHEYVNRLATYSGRAPNMIIMPYTCRLLNHTQRKSQIVQCYTTGFIAGAIAVCNWFGLDWRYYIDNLHTGNAALNIEL